MVDDLESQVKRLDLMCDVVASGLLQGTVSKATVRAFMSIAQKVVTAYYEEKENNAKP